MIITVTPNPAVDRTLDVGRLRHGEVNRVHNVRVEPSGKGVNVSRALTVNGLPAPAVFPAGGAEGAQLVALLYAEGVPHRAVPVGGSTRVNVSLCTEGQVTKVNEPGPVLGPEDGQALLDAVTELVRRARVPGTPDAGPDPALWIVGSGSLPAGLGDGFYAELGTVADAVGARLVLDSSGAALREGLRARPSLVKPNLTELEELSGRPLPTLGAVVEAAREVGRATQGAVLVSLGRRGALLVDSAAGDSAAGDSAAGDSAAGDSAAANSGTVRDDLPYHATMGPVLHAWAVVPDPNPVGGGDNLLAGFLAGLTRGMSRSQALREAVAWATVAVRQAGSVGRAVSGEDRAAVRLTAGPDPEQPSA